MEEKKKWSKGRIAWGIAILLFAMACFLPVPNYFLEVPGSAENLRSFVTVNGQRDHYDGSFMLTTVGIRRATAMMLFESLFQSGDEIVSQKELMGDSSSAEYDQMQKYYMTDSQNTATAVALKLADKSYEMEYKGVYVMSILPNSPFADQLKVGDTVNQINGKKFEESQEMIDWLKKEKVGSEITIGYEQEGHQKEATGKLIKLENGHPGIGITLVNHTEIKTPEKINIDAGSIGGPSAGLMFTLEIYTLVTQQDIRKGYEIAGTGTIDMDGKVGSIGGIDKKVRAASKEGAEIFFAPDEPVSKEIKKLDPKAKNNYQIAKETAEKIGTTMKIVPVKTVEEAIKYLEKLPDR